MQQPETRYAPCGDLLVAYQVFGTGDLDLVMSPGAASHVELHWVTPGFAAFMERLGEFARVISYDKCGTGLSDPRVGVATLDDRVAEVLAVMDAAEVEHAALCGYSEGAPAAVLFAATYPERCDRLILYGSFVDGTALPAWVDDLAQDWGTGRASMLLNPEASSARRPSASDVHFLGVFERAAASPGMARANIAAGRRINVTGVLPAVRCPTLVLHRSGDPLPIEQARLAADLVPGAKFVELPGGDHVPWVGDANAVVDEIEEFLLGTRHAPATDRVLATVLFTDIVGSTEQVAEVGDQSWGELLDRYEANVRREITRFRGREIFTKGDEFFVAFDGPARAVRCGIALHEVAHELGLTLRTGIHAGECEARGDDLAGIAVHVGARVMSLAAPGEVLVTSTVRDLVAGAGLRFVDRGRHRLRGVPEPWQVFAVPAEIEAAVSHAPQLRWLDRIIVRLSRRFPGVMRRYGERRMRRTQEPAPLGSKAAG